ncbi:OFA family MFS transporter [Streptococcus sp. zg-JUN1979]|uniref:L-lactate MFS transporter n=1 Tax=Streptococcus sp. zg-JUN1979 TaxID=3391450 RepID=UPI0039A5117B
MKTTNRYVVASAGVVLHLMLGSTYAWSIYRNPIMAETGWSQSEVAFAFSLAIFCLGLSAAFMGRLVERFGPRLTGSISAVLYAGGNILTGLAIAEHQLSLLYIAYGILGGIGLGAGYITPVSTIIKWFPDKRGLATGLAIMGFGFASLLTSPIAQALISHIGVVQTFYMLGIVYFVVMFSVSQFIKRPTKEELEALANGNDSKGHKPVTFDGLTANQALGTKSFYLMWFMLFINIACGLGIISAASPMAQDLARLSAEQAALMVGILGIFNGFGRLLWAGLSDYIGRPLTFSLLFLVNLVMTGLLFIEGQSLIFVVAMSLLMTCYGAGFSLIPAYLSDVFGTRELAALHGYILTAWAAAGLVGPLLLSETYEWSQSYTTTLLAFCVLYVIGFAISWYLKATIAKDKDKLSLKSKVK